MVFSLLRGIWRRRDTWLTLAFLAISLYCVLLLRGIRDLRTMPQILTVGQKLPSVTADDLQDHRVNIDWGSDGRSSLVYVFGESCIWCSRNMANIRTLATAANSQYRVIGVSLSDVHLRSYTQQNKMAFAVYKNATMADGKPFDADGTPETLVVSPSGLVTKRWLGAYQGETERQIEKTFEVRLPGLTSQTGSGEYTPAQRGLQSSVPSSPLDAASPGAPD